MSIAQTLPPFLFQTPITQSDNRKPLGYKKENTKEIFVLLKKGPFELHVWSKEPLRTGDRLFIGSEFSQKQVHCCCKSHATFKSVAENLLYCQGQSLHNMGTCKCHQHFPASVLLKTELPFLLLLYRPFQRRRLGL